MLDVQRVKLKRLHRNLVNCDVVALLCALQSRVEIWCHLLPDVTSNRWYLRIRPVLLQ